MEKKMTARIASLSLLILLSLFIQGCASGSAVVTGTKREPISADQVQIYLEPPKDYEVIGLVSASSDAGWTEQGSLDYAVDELKQQAAKIGANGVLLTATGDRTATAVGGTGTRYFYAVPVTAKTVQGKAIFVRR
ncbi:MAG: hypothetical protein K2X75_10895 [Burkholderiaceae bacterium]|nr:hypothetical protein [Burkholderiaceae bacterium]